MSGTATNNNSKSTNMDTKREEFRKYLEKEGILESLTKALVMHTMKALIKVGDV